MHSPVEYSEITLGLAGPGLAAAADGREQQQQGQRRPPPDSGDPRKHGCRAPRCTAPRLAAIAAYILRRQPRRLAALCSARAWAAVLGPANNRKHLRAFGPPGDARALHVRFALISLMALQREHRQVDGQLATCGPSAPPRARTCQDHLRGASGRRVIESAVCATERGPNAVSARVSCYPATAAAVAAPLWQPRSGGRGSLGTRSTANAIVGNRL